MTDNLFTIPSDRVFVDELATYLWKKTENNPSALAEYNIILPTNRSIRALKEAFIVLSKGKAALLPRMMTVNSFADDLYPYDFDDNDLKVIPDFSRLFLLSKLIMKTDNGMSFSKSLGLSSSLLNVLDDFTDYGIGYNDLARLVPENFAAHWQNVLKFLKIITENWNGILSENGYKDKRYAYNRKIDDIIAIWKDVPYDKPLIMAGLSYVSPTIKKLLPAVLQLPKGMVILYGLDRNISADVFNVIEENHHQYAFKMLLDGVSSFADVNDFTVFAGTSCDDIVRERLSFMNDVMRPASIIHKWPSSYSKKVLKGIYRFDCVDLDGEADTISVILRAVLEHEGKTAIVVTKNKDLARMIKGKMQRWRIFLDDSAGYPLSKSKTGIFLKLITNYALHQDNHTFLIELLKHPFSLFGRDFTTASRLSRKLEQNLRGRDHNYSLSEIKNDLCIEDAELSDWVSVIDKVLSHFLTVFSENKTSDFKNILSEHLKVAEEMAASPEDGYNLWSARGSFREGKVLSSLAFEILESASFIGNINLSEYGECLDLLLDRVTVRPMFGMNSRLDILSPIESRLQRADVVIIAGLNEDTWTENNNNPWLNREMKKNLGLLSDDFSVGLTAMDFINMASGKEVYLTRSLKEGGVPSNPSRWLLRMEALLEKQADDVKILAQKHGLLRSKERTDVFYTLEDVVVSYVCSFYRPKDDDIRKTAGEPKVAVKDDLTRFNELSLTDLGTLWHDPYAVYAKKVLDLKPLKSIEVENDYLGFGSLVHSILDDFVKNNGMSYAEMKRKGANELKKRGFKGVFWEKRLNRFIEWFSEFDSNEKKQIAASYSERTGEMPIGAFTIKAKADRIDFLTDGTIRIVDYKTSSSKNYTGEVVNDYFPQLPIEAVMAETGYFGFPGGKKISSLEYWQFNDKDGGKRTKVQGREKDVTVAELVDRYKEQTAAMLNYYSCSDAVYLSWRTGKTDDGFNADYDHLSRYKEWFDNADDDK